MEMNKEAKDIQSNLIQLAKDLRAMSVEIENLAFDMEDMTHKEYSSKLREITCKYQEKCIDII